MRFDILTIDNVFSFSLFGGTRAIIAVVLIPSVYLLHARGQKPIKRDFFECNFQQHALELELEAVFRRHGSELCSHPPPSSSGAVDMVNRFRAFFFSTAERQIPTYGFGQSKEEANPTHKDVQSVGHVVDEEDEKG